jgi:hypothetical protein
MYMQRKHFAIVPVAVLISMRIHHKYLRDPTTGARTSGGVWTLNGVAVPGLESDVDLDFGFTPATTRPPGYSKKLYLSKAYLQRHLRLTIFKRCTKE